MSTASRTGHQGGENSITRHREGSPALCTLPGSGYDSPLRAGGGRSRFAGAGTRHAASAALCWLSPAALGSPAARRSNLEDDAQIEDDALPALLTPGVAAALVPVLANCPGLEEGTDVVPVSSLPPQHPFTEVALWV